MKNKIIAMLLVSTLFSRADVFIPISDVAGQNRDLRFQTSDVNRAILRLNSDAETGSNAGSNLVINLRADDGSNLGNFFKMTRATGDSEFFSTTEATAAGAGSLKTDGGLRVLKKVIADGTGSFGSVLSVSGGAAGSLGAQIRVSNSAAKTTGNTAQIFFDTFTGAANSWSIQAIQESTTDADQTLRVALGGITQVLWFTPLGAEAKTTTEADIAAGEGSIAADGGIFAKKAVATATYYEGTEQATAPAAPPADGFRIYALDNGSGKTQVYIRFATGAPVLLATQP